MFSRIKKMIPWQWRALPLFVAMVNLSRTKLQVFVCVYVRARACVCLYQHVRAGVSERVIKIRPDRCQNPLSPPWPPSPSPLTLPLLTAWACTCARVKTLWAHAARVRVGTGGTKARRRAAKVASSSLSRTRANTCASPTVHFLRCSFLPHSTFPLDVFFR